MFSQFDDKGKIFTRVVTKKPVDVTIQTSIHRIQGKIHVRPEDRLKDELNRTEPFLAITDASVFDTQGKILYQCSFLTLNSSQIVWMIPDDEINTQKEVG